MTPEAQYIRTILAESLKRAQEEAARRRLDLEEWERRHGIVNRLDQTRAYREVTGRTVVAGAEKAQA